MSNDFWNSRYRKNQYEWGLGPNETALIAGELVSEGSRILDLSCGYGRDSLYLARQGFQMTGLDLSQVAVEMAKDLADQENLNIDFICADFREWPVKKESFGAVLVFNLLQMFDRPTRQTIIEKMIEILVPGGWLILAAFSTEDPDFGRGKLVEENTFKNQQERLRHFYTKEELEEVFTRMEIIRLEEFSLPGHEHGDRKRHTHREWLVVARKPNRFTFV